MQLHRIKYQAWWWGHCIERICFTVKELSVRYSQATSDYSEYFSLFDFEIGRLGR